MHYHPRRHHGDPRVTIISTTSGDHSHGGGLAASTNSSSASHHGYVWQVVPQDSVELVVRTSGSGSCDGSGKKKSKKKGKKKGKKKKKGKAKSKRKDGKSGGGGDPDLVPTGRPRAKAKAADGKRARKGKKGKSGRGTWGADEEARRLERWEEAKRSAARAQRNGLLVSDESTHTVTAVRTSAQGYVRPGALDPKGRSNGKKKAKGRKKKDKKSKG